MKKLGTLVVALVAVLFSLACTTPTVVRVHCDSKMEYIIRQSADKMYYTLNLQFGDMKKGITCKSLSSGARQESYFSQFQTLEQAEVVIEQYRRK